MSTHYEERMEADLGEIKRKVRKVSDLVELQVQRAIEAFLTGTVDLANQAVLGDRQVNRRIKELDYLCHSFIVRHAPSAGHLRFVSAVLRLAVALERVGDYAGMMGREVVRLSAPPPATIRRDIDMMGHQARHTLSQALRAFHNGDVSQAKASLGLSEQTDITLNTVIGELIECGEKGERSIKDLFALQRIVNLITRVTEQADNVAEQTVFATTGEMRDPRVFRVLFVDEHNDRSSQIAEAYARKAFPERGRYRSAGWRPSDKLDPKLLEFMDGRGIDLSDAVPKRLQPLSSHPEHFHVIVSFAAGARDHLGELPYRTTLLEWQTGIGAGTDPQTLEALYQDLAVRVRDLMTTLAGPEAR
jgi:phosphate transport system protein